RPIPDKIVVFFQGSRSAPIFPQSFARPDRKGNSRPAQNDSYNSKEIIPRNCTQRKHSNRKSWNINERKSKINHDECKRTYECSLLMYCFLVSSGMKCPIQFRNKPEAYCR